MFKWVTKELVRIVIKLLFTIALVISLFLNEYQPATVYALIMILMEVEEMNDRQAKNEPSP
jgi:uncharacterized membrane protein